MFAMLNFLSLSPYLCRHFFFILQSVPTKANLVFFYIRSDRVQ